MSTKRVLILIISFVILGTLGGGTYLYINIQTIVNEILRTEIISKYNNSPDTKYLISVEEVKLNIITGSVKLTNLDVIPKDSLVAFKTSVTEKVYQSTNLIISIDEIELSNFDYLTAYTEQRLIAKEFSIKSPVVQIYKHQGDIPEFNEVQDTVDLRSIFLTNYKSVNLGRLNITDAQTTFHTVSLQNDTSLVFTVNHLSYFITDVFANASTLYSPEFIIFKEYDLLSKNLSIELKNGALLRMDKLRYNSNQDDFIVSNFKFIPPIKPDKFFKSLKYGKAWIGFNFSKAIISNLDIIHLYKNVEIIASSLTLTNPNLSVFTNATIPLDPNLDKPMLGALLKSLKIPYFVGYLTVNNAIIDIDMIGKQTPIHGKLQFHDLTIKAKNLTNIESQIKQNNTLSIQANSKVNKTGNISASFKINLEDKNSTTQFNVAATQLRLKAFNSVLKPILRVSVTDGEIKSLTVSSTLSRNGAIGTMDMHYENLKLQLEGKEINKDPGIFNKMASGMANGILKSDNIPDEKNYHQGEIRFQKKKTDSFFKMLWLVNLNGIEDSILGSDARDDRRETKKQRKREKQNKSSSKKKWF